jgi:hypothetical protein
VPERRQIPRASVTAVASSVHTDVGEPVSEGCPTATTGIPGRSAAATRGSFSWKSTRIDPRSAAPATRFLYMPSQDLGVISTSLFRFKGPFGAHWETISAGAILVILPTLIVFLCLQRYIYNGFTRGASR